MLTCRSPPTESKLGFFKRGVFEKEFSLVKKSKMNAVSRQESRNTAMKQTSNTANRLPRLERETEKLVAQILLRSCGLQN